MFDRNDAITSVWQDAAGHDFNAAVCIFQSERWCSRGLGASDRETVIAAGEGGVGDGDAVHHDAVKGR